MKNPRGERTVTRAQLKHLFDVARPRVAGVYQTQGPQWAHIVWCELAPGERRPYTIIAAERTLGAREVDALLAQA